MPPKFSPPINDAQRLAWLRLSRTENVGPITFRKLMARYGSASAALEAMPEIVARRGGKNFKIYPIASAEKEMAAARKIGVHFLFLGSPEYPPLLAQTDDAPPVLMLRGRLDLMQTPGIAIVGARNASLPGRRMAEVLARDLAKTESEMNERSEKFSQSQPRSGFSIVSGLARGIDTAAHAAALAAGGGTVAVLAGGVDVVYPQENQKLYDEIADRGAIVAENAPGYPPTNRDFPRRNRIISGLSLATIVVEAALKSGSLITAEYALQQGREVMAVPGSPMDPRAGGTNKLIKDGAQLVENAEDVMRALLSMQSKLNMENALQHLEEQDNFETPHAPYEEAYLAQLCTQILSDLTYAPTAIEDLMAATGAPAAALQTAILELELTGEVQRLPSNRLVKLPPLAQESI